MYGNLRFSNNVTSVNATKISGKVTFLFFYFVNKRLNVTKYPFFDIARRPEVSTYTTLEQRPSRMSVSCVDTLSSV